MSPTSAKARAAGDDDATRRGIERVEQIASGAVDLLPEPVEAIADPVELPRRGGLALLTPTVTRRLITELAHRGHPRPELARRLGELTERERDTLRQLARGLSNVEVAAAMMVSEHTVKTHVSSVLTKLGLRDRVQAVVFAYEAGLVTPGGLAETG
ncbi:helix-turn-helix transcriptional regulator [Nocardia iowensis]|uniref:helix-turn-helix transcriptional regulator n=1 Tax=Nocardia iowensis TaxID=204891 RepID=UPI003371D44D